MSTPWAQSNEAVAGRPPRRARRPSSQTSAGRPAELELDDVGGLLALRPLDHIKLHPIALRQRAEAFAGDRREMDEHVLAPFAFDEAESLRVVEPLDHALDARSRALHTHRRRATVGTAAWSGAPLASAPTSPTSMSAGSAGARGLPGLEAVPAVDGAIAGGLERHHGLGAAVGAHGGEHRTRGAAAAVPAIGRSAPATPLSLAALATTLAARRGVGQPVVAVELLFTDGECEFFPAVHTLDDSVLKSSHVRRYTSGGLR